MYNENTLELTALDWLANQGYEVLHWPEIDPDSANPLRADYDEVVLKWVLREQILRINDWITDEIAWEAVKQIITISHPNLVESNHIFHRFLTDWIDVPYRRNDGSEATFKVRLVDTKNLENNRFMAVNQFSIRGKKTRRPDILVFINGLPVSVFELKNPADENTTIAGAYNQLQTYKNDISDLFFYNEILVISDGTEAKMWSLTANMDRFMSWKSVDGEDKCSRVRQLECLIKWAFDRSRLIDLIFNFTLFQTDGDNTFKILSAYHQYFAVNKAVKSTLQAVESWDKKWGVVWHTQWSGKSFSMVFYAGAIIKKLDNPTILVITDRNDLDDQLFSNFSKSSELFRQTPKQAKNRDDLMELLNVSSGWVVFTTIQKFSIWDMDEYPVLSERKNIIVVADEAHRTQYGFSAKIKDDKISYWFAKYLRDWLPNATFIGFTGTPIEFTDKNTKAVFGDYVDVYDIAQAVEDKATVPIYYEARLANINIDESKRPKLDHDFEEITEWEEETSKEKLKSKWARLEAMVWSEERLELVARDIVSHFENRNEAIEGKAMIVCMSRRISVDLYDQIIKIRPEWHNDDDKKWVIKVVMTGSASDPENFQAHIRSKQARDEMALRMKDTKDELKLVVVRDMWLTGFDVPNMHTMYIDKPMKWHNLMQAIARVNRIYKDKQAGLIVDYLGIAYELKEALSYYTASWEQRDATIPIEQAINVMLEKYRVVADMFHNFDYKSYFSWTPAERTEIFSSALELVLSMEDGKKRYKEAVTALSYAFSIAMPSKKAEDIRDDVWFFQAIKAWIMKLETSGGWDVEKKSKDEYSQAIKQIVSWAVKSAEIIDLFKFAWLETPDLSILSEEFLEDVKWMKHKNLAFELLKKLINNQIKSLTKKNLIKSRSFVDMLDATIKKYQNRNIESAEVIAELVELAKKIKKEQEVGWDLWLNENEVAFYDALSDNESAKEMLWDETLKAMARELVQLIRNNTTIDWTKKENVQARLRVAIKRLLKKYDYPPDKQEKAIEIVMKQAKLWCEEIVWE